MYCIPALIAEAEASGAQTKEILRALLIAYEIVAKIAECFEYENLKLHGHASLAAIGAAAAVAITVGISAVSYTHLTLPTKRIV